MVKEVTFVGFRGAIAPITPTLDPPMCVNDRFAGNWRTWLQVLACSVLRKPKIIFVRFCTCMGMLLTKGNLEQNFKTVQKSYERDVPANL